MLIWYIIYIYYIYIFVIYKVVFFFAATHWSFSFCSKKKLFNVNKLNLNRAKSNLFLLFIFCVFLITCIQFYGLQNDKPTTWKNNNRCNIKFCAPQKNFSIKKLFFKIFMYCIVVRSALPFNFSLFFFGLLSACFEWNLSLKFEIYEYN